MDTETGLPLPATLEEAHALLVVVWATVGELRTALGQVREESAELAARVQALEARLGQNSSNSSRPPSTDPPRAPARPEQPASGRRRGGQPGHEGRHRLVLSPEQVDQVVAHWPTVCAGCAAPLPADPALLAAAAERHQVTEVPPVRAIVTEHQLQRVRCPACGHETRATLPPEVPTGAFGPRLQAAVAVLSGRYRLSRREVVGVLADLHGATVSLGSVDELCRATARALAEPLAALEVAVRAAPVANADETSWAQAGQSRWLWVVVTALATVFRVASSRGSDVIKGLLGEDFAGVVGSDRWTADTWLGTIHRQVCWAHPVRAQSTI